ncbi:hypothetical protein P692DRAFT_20882132 [Suillus brevipes Sb2]|nr:hypothetical protein P692DRAFT_20882132 [Suillus brevipes Sb2]
MLTGQLELFGSPHRSTRLVTDEILPPKVSIILRLAPHTEYQQLKTTLAPEFKLAALPSKNTDRFHSPYQKRVSFEHSRSRMPISLDSLSDSDSSTSAGSLSDDSKIPKPPGEPGCPGRGGYTLREALDWSPKAYTKFKHLKNSMHHLIEEHLDTTKCASSQSPSLLQIVRDKAIDAFPDLDNYSEFWPVNDMIMMRLKYTSGRARQKDVEMAAGKSKKHTFKKT